MAIKIQLRRGTAAEWTSANPVLMQGEMGVETDTLKVKIGNGSTAWTTLPYFTQGAKGDKGDQGIQGIQGVIGNTGPTGPVGPPNSLTVGTVTSGIAGSSADVTITGTSPNQVLNLTIPRGDKGDAATIAVGTVTQVAAGQPLTITNSGTSAAAVLNFSIPNAVGVPTGGTTGQIVRKTSSATEWASLSTSDLSDVQVSSPVDKQVLQYESGKWKNKQATGGVTVSNTTPASPIDGDGLFYSEDGTLFIRYNDGNSTQWVQPNAVLSSQIEQRYYSPNYVINGGFDIWQRGTATVSGIGNTAFHPDRWLAITDAVGTVNSSRVDISAQGIGSQYAWRLERSAGTNRWVAIQMVEGALSMVGKTITVSGYIRKGSALTSDVNVHLSTRTAKFGSQAESMGDLTVANSSLSTSAFTRFSKTFKITTATSTAGADLFELEIFASQAGATNAYFEIAGVQLEEGLTATPFRRNANSIQGELAACQRYFYRLPGLANASGISNSSGGFIVRINLPITMRANPTFSVGSGSLTWSDDYAADGGGTYTGFGYYGIFNQQQVRVQINTNGASTVGRYYAMGNTNSGIGSAYADFTAEL